MIYNAYGKTGLNVSRFGLGCMRFPKEEAEAIEMVRYAIDNGVNYIDTAYVYGDSEVITGKALRDGYRQKVTLVTKCPPWNAEKPADLERLLDESLARMQTDHFDMYLAHNMDPDNWTKWQRLDGLKFLDDMKKKGKILHKGFSCHNSTEGFKKIVDASDWEMAQLQLNILDENQQVGVEGLKYAAAKGLAMVVMEPLRGGNITKICPPQAYALIEEYGERRNLIEWCFRWLYNFPEVSVILSGTSTLDQLKDNLRIFEDAKPNCLSASDLEMLKKVQTEFLTRTVIGCTGCKYCMPCPQGVDIPGTFSQYNAYQMTKPATNEKTKYQKEFAAKGAGADSCVGCNVCKEHCPQHLDIPQLLKSAHKEVLAA
jgi:predicted aldo/keto reductase-like oxidoreductase